MKNEKLSRRRLSTNHLYAQTPSVSRDIVCARWHKPTLAEACAELPADNSIPQHDCNQNCLSNTWQLIPLTPSIEIQVSSSP